MAGMELNDLLMGEELRTGGVLGDEGLFRD